MPKQYEAIRDKLIRQGVPEAEAKRRAAKIFNAQRKKGQRPVTGKHKKVGGKKTSRRARHKGRKK